jgi:hypothetical protein
MKLDSIKHEGTWNDIASSLNSNFSKIQQAINSGNTGGGGGTIVSQTTYIHYQNSSSSVWVITHYLGRFPSVTVVDSAGSEVVGDVTYDSDNQVTVRFMAAFSGKAYLN